MKKILILAFVICLCCKSKEDFNIHRHFESLNQIIDSTIIINQTDTSLSRYLNEEKKYSFKKCINDWSRDSDISNIYQDLIESNNILEVPLIYEIGNPTWYRYISYILLKTNNNYIGVVIKKPGEVMKIKRTGISTTIVDSFLYTLNKDHKIFTTPSIIGDDIIEDTNYGFLTVNYNNQNNGILLYSPHNIEIAEIKELLTFIEIFFENQVGYI